MFVELINFTKPCPFGAVEGVLSLAPGIDVWEGASGASRDAPRFGLKSNSVSNARKKIRKSTKKMEDFTRI